MALRIFEAYTFEECAKHINSMGWYHNHIFLIYLGIKDKYGLYWNPQSYYCERELDNYIRNQDFFPRMLVLIKIRMTEEQQKNPLNKFRLYQDFLLSKIPTIKRWGDANYKLEESDACNPEKIRIFFSRIRLLPKCEKNGHCYGKFTWLNKPDTPPPKTPPKPRPIKKRKVSPTSSMESAKLAEETRRRYIRPLRTTYYYGNTEDLKANIIRDIKLKRAQEFEIFRRNNYRPSFWKHLKTAAPYAIKKIRRPKKVVKKASKSKAEPPLQTEVNIAEGSTVDNNTVLEKTEPDQAVENAEPNPNLEILQKQIELEKKQELERQQLELEKKQEQERQLQLEKKRKRQLAIDCILDLVQSEEFKNWKPPDKKYEKPSSINRSINQLLLLAYIENLEESLSPPITMSPSELYDFSSERDRSDQYIDFPEEEVHLTEAELKALILQEERENKMGLPKKKLKKRKAKRNASHKKTVKPGAKKRKTSTKITFPLSKIDNAKTRALVKAVREEFLGSNLNYTQLLNQKRLLKSKLDALKKMFGSRSLVKKYNLSESEKKYLLWSITNLVNKLCRQVPKKGKKKESMLKATEKTLGQNEIEKKVKPKALSKLQLPGEKKSKPASLKIENGALKNVDLKVTRKLVNKK